MPAGETQSCRVAVVIVNWNSGVYLSRAVSAVSKQDYPHRLIVVDNASTDGSIERIREDFPSIEIIRASSNMGFAAANNLAISRVRNVELIALLNPDAFPEPHWLRRLVSAAVSHPDYACFASRVVSDENPDLIDGAGDEYHVSGFAWRRGQGASASLYGSDGDIYIASATAVLYRREVLEEAGGFDERFFCYYEDVDLGLRLRLLGYRTRFVADAVVRHVGSGITGKRSAFVTYHTQRNRLWTFVKNIPAPWVLVLLPTHLLYQCAALVRYASQGQPLAAFSGTLASILGLPSVLRDRRAVQSRRRATWQSFRKGMKWGFLAPLRRR